MWTTLISAEELASLDDKKGLAIVDCRFDLANPAAGRMQYDEGHLPGARYSHLDEDLSSPITAQTGRHPLPSAELLAEKFGRWGIDKSTQIVAYDASGGAFASRLWWLARWLGHEAVAVLDGGWPVWNAAGLPVTTDVPTTKPHDFTPHVDDSMWLSTLDVAAMNSELVLVDAREAERFRGEIEPIDPVAGHIPGANNLPWKGNLAAEGTFLPARDLEQRFAHVRNGSLPIACMCGSGVTACHNLLALEIAGMKGAKLYAGSWSEWIREASRPVARSEE